MKQEKKQPGRLKMLAGYYKPYKGLFFADLFFAFLGAAVTLVIPLMVRYIMNSISEMPAAEAKTMILKIGVVTRYSAAWAEVARCSHGRTMM